MSNVQSYLQHLVETIGPRPTSSDTERLTAEWIHSVFQSHGLASTIQDIETPRSHAVAEAVAYLALVVALVLMGVVSSGWLAWVLWAVLAFLAVSAFLSARGRQTLSVLMPKGPSQNVVARYAPHSQRGERRRKVVVVAHYDTAVPTLLEAPVTVRIYEAMVRYARVMTYAIPVVTLIYVLPIAVLEPAHRWVWYLTLVASLLPLVLAVNALSALFLKRFSPGANTNASGVAALLAVVDDLAGESRGVASPGETSRIPRATSSFGAVGGSRSQVSSFDDEELFAGAGYGASSADLPDDFSWAPSPSGTAFGAADDLDLMPVSSAQPGLSPTAGYSPAMNAFADSTDRPAAPTPSGATPDAPSLRGSRDSRTTSFATVEFAAVPEESQQTVSFAPIPSSVTPFGGAPREDVLGPDVISLGEQAPSIQPMDFGDRSKKRSIFDFIRREPRDGENASGDGLMSRSARKRRGGKHSAGSGDSADWLGLSSDFEATSAGEEIGSWDNFSDGDSSGWKGGWAEGDLIEDSHYAEEEDARIRRKVAESATVSLDDKEVWFIATGAGAEGNAGMKAILAEYGNELRGAAFINLESVGAGQLHWLPTEGVHGDVRATSRLVSIAKRASKDTGILAKVAKLTGQTTDATVVMRAKMKAFTLVRLVDGARPATSATTGDALSTVDAGLVAETAAYVSELVRQS